MSHPFFRLLAALALVACSGREASDAPIVDTDVGPEIDGEDDPETISFPSSSGSTAETASTGTTGETGLPPFDCSTIPEFPLSTTTIPNARGYHGLALDTLGRILGSDNTSLLAVDYSGDSSLIAPNVGSLQGMDWLHDGDLVVASPQTNALVRVNVTTGAVSLLSTGINVYGVLVGPDGLVYAADQIQVWRVDPVTGNRTVFVPPDVDFYPQSVNFSPDFSKFYVTSQTGWALWEMDLDANLDRIGPKRQLADFGASFRDGLAVDWCGNLYVPDYGTSDLYRISPTGRVQLYIDFPDATTYGHFAVFGSGIGGFKHDAIYMPQPYNGNQVIEVEIGIPSRSWVF